MQIQFEKSRPILDTHLDAHVYLSNSSCIEITHPDSFSLPPLRLGIGGGVYEYPRKQVCTVHKLLKVEMHGFVWIFKE